jgi:DNA-binding MarR family transcriptional regulator
MGELARSALLSRSGLTRLVDKLEKEGLIRRRACPTDGRVQHVELTEKGLEVLRKIWPVYRAGITRYFAAHLSEAEARQVVEIFSRVRSGVEQDEVTPAK